MKIVFLNYYQNQSSRGVESFINELAKRLGRHHEVKVVGGQITDHFKKYRFGWRFYLDSQSLAIKKFTEKVLIDLDPDTDVIIPTNGGWQSLLCRHWANKYGKKVVILGHSGIGWDDRINLWTRPDVFVALSDEQKRWAEKWDFGVRVEKIADGVDLDAFNPQIKPIEAGLKRPIILCVAALEKDKRINLVIEAVAKLPSASLLIIGSGSQKQALEKLGNNKLPGRFKIISVAHKNIPGYYNGANVFTMTPLSTESFGMVYLEAMASGLPIVASDDPIRQEIIGEAGLFVDPENIDEYSESLKRALQINWADKPRRQAGEFSWEKIASQYEELFQKL